MTPIRYAYSGNQATIGPSRRDLAFLPITLRNGSKELMTPALLDSGSTVNVLPYSIGLQLGFVWGQQKTSVRLTGSLAKVPARGVIVLGQVEQFPSVELAFAWTQERNIPLILGQINFFMEFDVCFFRSRGEFQISPKE